MNEGNTPYDTSPSGYPLTIREWKRGTDFADAKEIWRGEPTDVVAAGMAYWDKDTYYKAGTSPSPLTPLPAPS